ncbi:TPR repeat protein [Candidatus Koribacter versatilis Ellin345]|uniref:TPR repeat protein n=1 Tax=Koribacter versatilis (strain Ellin345) TaxID=204669 RepID=Q1IUM1_KORVE|nr:tetratricopeptide repeat protein [Candidatus Koribacter versatilis]ABF39429.1 TPR repeat protein [Candidatus Koribacter versatilis Ellin345]
MRTLIGFCCLLISGVNVHAQAASNSPANSPASPKAALRLAQEGHCKEALPALKKGLASAAKDDHRDLAMAGVRCAMFMNQPESALEFLRVLEREFPSDPDTLYLLVHTYSDLSTHAAAELATKHGNTYQARELNAEALESQGKWQEAEKEYKTILEANPKAVGIHFRLGRLLLSAPNPPADMAEQAKREFEAELAVDPTNAGAEYVLGELAKTANSYDDAIQHFSKATKLDPSFAAAYLGIGTSLVAQKKFAEAVTPLETAVKLQPANPAGHYNLATAYSRTGRKADADREFAIHNEMMQRSGGASAPVQQPQ